MKKFLLFLVVLGGLTAGVAYYSNNALFESLPKNTVEYSLPEKVVLQHPAWQDGLVKLENNRIRRQSRDEQGSVQNITPTSFEIVWDKWGIEAFKKNPETGVYHFAGSRAK